MFFIQTTVVSITATLRLSEEVGPPLLGAVCVALYLAFAWHRCTWGFCAAFIPSSVAAPLGLSWLLDSSGDWVDQDKQAPFVHDGSLFGGYREHRQWFGLCELVCNCAIGVLVGWQPAQALCSLFAILTAAVNALFLGVLIALRPHRKPADLVMAVTVAVLSLAVAVAVLVFPVDVAYALVTACMFVLALKTLLDLVEFGLSFWRNGDESGSPAAHAVAPMIVTPLSAPQNPLHAFAPAQQS
jgi:hypothetical protein